MSIAVGLHIMVTDYDLGTEYPKIFDKRGRFLLASAALFGLMFRYWRPDGELFRDIFTAFLAGSIIYQVFKRELPHPENVNMRWFTAGIVVYGVLMYVLHFPH